MKSLVDSRRIRPLNNREPRPGPIVYWMSRDQRVRDNWALLYAAELARNAGQPLGVLFCLAPSYLGATSRQYDFMLRGLAEVETELRDRGIRFALLPGRPDEQVVRFAHEHEVGAVVADSSPLRPNREWRRAAARGLDVPLFDVDAHNIVPCWLASSKQEYSARTFRPRIGALLGEFLVPFPRLPGRLPTWPGGSRSADWSSAGGSLRADRSVPPVADSRPGTRAAAAALRRFIRSHLRHYAAGRNDPNAAAVSGLSPYLHFGQLSAQRVALTVRAARAPVAAKEAFIEQLVVRRELADNFCLHNSDYDRFAGLPDWSRRTLTEHRADRREYVYAQTEFEQARTHDALWNAAQQGLVETGRMHGYLRMYWAKKILEWSESPERAVAIAVRLNDRYALDGRDPNGYVGVLWAIGGLHDRPWFTRPVYGSVRYMSRSGCEAKLDVEAYVRRSGRVDTSGRRAIISR